MAIEGAMNQAVSAVVADGCEVLREGCETRDEAKLYTTLSQLVREHGLAEVLAALQCGTDIAKDYVVNEAADFSEKSVKDHTTNKMEAAMAASVVAMGQAINVLK